MYRNDSLIFQSDGLIFHHDGFTMICLIHDLTAGAGPGRPEDFCRED